MSNLILPGRRRASQISPSQAAQMQSLQPLLLCSHDINLWKITRIGRPDWAPPSCHHALLFYDRKTGYEKPILIDRNTAVDGDFTYEERRLTEAFASSLIQAKEVLDYVRVCRIIGKTPDISELGRNLLQRVKKDLHRGDHDNDFAS